MQDKSRKSQIPVRYTRFPLLYCPRKAASVGQAEMLAKENMNCKNIPREFIWHRLWQGARPEQRRKQHCISQSIKLRPDLDPQLYCQGPFYTVYNLSVVDSSISPL
jgi:hypothetical protein